MKILPVPEAALDGTFGTPVPPDAGPLSGEYSNPSAIPASPSPGEPAPIDHGPSTQPSMYQYPYPPKG